MSGHIHSDDYPKETEGPEKRHRGEYLCHWKIRPPSGHKVVISILDIQTSGSKEDCDAGLVISGNSCQSDAPASSNICRREAGKRLIHCGNVDIKLRRSEIVFPLRFWLYFQMQPMEQTSAIQPSLACLANDENKKGSGSSAETDSHLSHIKKPTLTDILIILLSIISGISIVLFVILIVFCIRYRSLHVQHSEPLYDYQDISPGLQAHYEYISSLEPELDKNRPELVDGYFEVADALPVQERGATPTSPAYAEVEQVAQMRRLIFSDDTQSHTNSTDGTYSVVASGLEAPNSVQDISNSGKTKDRESKDPNSQNSSLTDIPSKSAGCRPKRTVLERLKGVPGIAFGERDKKVTPAGDVSPKLYNSRSSNGQSARSVLKGKTSGPSATRQKIGRLFGSREDVASRDIPDTASEAGSEPAYEMVEEFVPLSVTKLGTKTKPKLGVEKQLPALPSTNPPSDNKQKQPNRKSDMKQQEALKNSHVYANPTSPSISQKYHLEKKAGEGKERTNFSNNQKSKMVSNPAVGTRPSKPKNAKTDSTIPQTNGKHTITDRKPGSSSLVSASASPKNIISTAFKPDPKKEGGSNVLMSDSSGTKNNNYKPIALKDMPRSKGIVRNGIQRFEQSSSTSNE
ncbi:hypothetical protein EGW08_015918 [Elysia chlorotica]|uniref:CUB domain-containing protein n=1 Tax=Elysia chlorotica TaxID=188477 RepID=A0A3S1B571_ELYCH|nr:hypothetical protein EGW08_015918 [Elysia chlorotica]